MHSRKRVAYSLHDSAQIVVAWLLIAAGLLGLSACGPKSIAVGGASRLEQGAVQSDLVVFAASSLTGAFEAIAQAFERENPSVRVLTNYGSSSQLAVQLVEGAQADVFAPANVRQMDFAAREGRIAGDALTFARNKLTAIVPVNNPGQIQTLSDLGRPGILLILAVPGVPIRDYTDALIERLAMTGEFGPEFRRDFYKNLVSEEDNVRVVVAKVALGEADAAMVYASDITPDVVERLIRIEVPEAYQEEAIYPIAVVTGAPQPELAQRYIHFLMSEEGQDLLAEWGFLPALSP